MLLAEHVDQRVERVSKSSVVLIPVERVRAQRNQEPLAMMKLVLPINVEHKAVVKTTKLPYPLDLHWPSEASTMHIKGSGIHRYVKDVAYRDVKRTRSSWHQVTHLRRHEQRLN